MTQVRDTGTCLERCNYFLHSPLFHAVFYWVCLNLCEIICVFGKFCSDLQSTSVITSPPEDLNDLVNDLHRSLASLLDTDAFFDHVPFQTVLLSYGLMTKSKQLRSKDGKKEKVWRKSRSDEDRKAFCSARNKVSSLIHEAKSEYFQAKIVNCEGDQRKIFEIINEKAYPNCRLDPLKSY